MENERMLDYLKAVVDNMPKGWLSLTTHRLDIYNEKLAKTEFLGEFEKLYEANNSDSSSLNKIPTAYDYIRLGHPLSCVLEWGIAKLNHLNTENVISFSSATVPILSILRKNLFNKKNTQIIYTEDLADFTVLTSLFRNKMKLVQLISIVELTFTLTYFPT